MIEHAKYPPEGLRSIGGTFGPYGVGMTIWSEYAQIATRETLVAVQIESASALEQVDDILSVPGVDVAFVGPNNLHAQSGLTPSSDGAEPEFMAALARIQASARRHNVALGIFSSDGEAAARRVSQGFHMISVTTDISSLIVEAMRNLSMARG